MNIIFLSPEAIYPANTGGRVVVYNRIKYLSEFGNDICVLSVVDSDDEGKIQGEYLDKKGIKYINYNRNSNKILNIMKSAFNSYAVASRTIKQIQKDVERLIVENNIDLIIVEFPQMANNIKKISKRYNIPIVLSFHNIEYMTMKNISKNIKNIMKRFVYVIDSYRLKIFEMVLYKKDVFDGFIFVSEADKKYFEKNLNYRNKSTALVPIGSEDHGNISKAKHDNKNIIIVGKMSYYPNIEGVMWFYNNVWNKVKSEIEDVKLYIVGKDPSSEIRNIEDSDVIVTGTVDSVEDYYKIADVAVIPIFSGGGVKTKLIEASSFRVPIVSTLQGAKGTDFKNKEHLFIENTSEEFAKCIIKALQNDEDVKKMVDNCYKLFKKKYNWEGICCSLLEFLGNLEK